MGTLSSVIATTPTYELTLPSNGKKIEYRPFLVKEEKILLIASESKNEQEMYRAMQDVVGSCTFGKMNMSESPMMDIEYLFLKIRSKSVGETTKPLMKCSKCGVSNEVVIDLASVEPVRDSKHSNRIEISKDLILEMRYPVYADIEKMQGIEKEADRLFRLMASCIEKIYTQKSTFVTKELDFTEVIEFLENLTQSQFKKLAEFFETMPQLKKDVQYQCKKCGNDETLTLRGAQDFF
jgi:hypothetical protein